MNIFYTSQIQNSEALLTEEEARHINVLRKNAGDTLLVTDGKGKLFSGAILNISKKKVLVGALTIHEKVDTNTAGLHIAIAPTKNISRFEWFLEKSTEIGIKEITPILCDRSERKVIKPQRLEKILISAMKQSLNFSLPVLHPLVKFDQFVKTRTEKYKFIAHAHENAKEIYQSGTLDENVLICIGPEGDFSQVELNKAEENDFQLLSLGDSRLRTETAGVVACHSVKFWRNFSKKTKA